MANCRTNTGWLLVMLAVAANLVIGGWGIYLYVVYRLSFSCSADIMQVVLVLACAGLAVGGVSLLLSFLSCCIICFKCCSRRLCLLLRVITLFIGATMEIVMLAICTYYRYSTDCSTQPNADLLQMFIIVSWAVAVGGAVFAIIAVLLQCKGTKKHDDEEGHEEREEHRGEKGSGKWGKGENTMGSRDRRKV